MAHSDVRIAASNGQEKFAQSGATDAARGTILLNAVSQLAAGDHLMLGPGGFDVGTSLIEPSASGVIISGAGWQTIVRGQPPSAPPMIDAVFRPVGDDIELRDIAMHATGGSGRAFGSTDGKPSGDRFIGRGVRLTGIASAISTRNGNNCTRVSRWWDCDFFAEGGSSVARAAVLGEYDRADFFACRFHSKTTSGPSGGVLSDAATQQVQRFYNCDLIAESISGLVEVASSFGAGLEFYGGRLIGSPPGNVGNVAGHRIRLFGAMTNLPDGVLNVRYDSNIPRWRVIELVPADFVQFGGYWTSLTNQKFFELEDGELVMATLIVPVEKFEKSTQPPITDYKISVGSVELNNPQLYANATDVDVVPGDTIFHLEDRRVLPTLLSTAPTFVRVFATSTGANPNQATTGKVRIHLLTVRPWPYVRRPFNPVP